MIRIQTSDSSTFLYIPLPTRKKNLTWITKDGPPAVISGGICDNGQFSILMISNEEHNANSYGKLCNDGLSFIYNDFKLSSEPKKTKIKTVYKNKHNFLPISSGKAVKLFSPALRSNKLDKFLK